MDVPLLAMPYAMARAQATNSPNGDAPVVLHTQVPLFGQGTRL
jgi:hypothetical protein